MLETRGTLLVPCMLEVIIPLLEVVVEIGIATGEDEGGEDEAAEDVEGPATGAVSSLRGQQRLNWLHQYWRNLQGPLRRSLQE